MFVKRVRAPGAYNDGGNLYLNVDRGGSRSWVFRYGAGGKHWHGLGPLHTISLSEARERARDCRKLLLEGRDPISESRARKAAAKLDAARTITFADAAEEFIKSHEAAWKSPRNAEQWRASLRDHAFPLIGKLPVAAIDTALVMRVLTPIWSEKSETAGRIRMRVERILDWAKVRGYRDGSTV